jgi:hypothetical protein
VDGILTLQTPDQLEHGVLSRLKVNQHLADKFPCTHREMDRWSLPKIYNWGIRASENHDALYHRDFGIQGRGYFPMGKSHAPLKGKEL